MKGSFIMNTKKDIVVCIVLMNMVMAELEKIIETEIDKGELGNYRLVDLLIEINENLSSATEIIGEDLI